MKQSGGKKCEKYFTLTEPYQTGKQIDNGRLAQWSIALMILESVDSMESKNRRKSDLLYFHLRLFKKQAHESIN